MPRSKKYINPIISALVLVTASVTTGALYLMHQAIVIAEDLSLGAYVVDAL